MILPEPHKIDARSLAAFRILTSAYILHDIYRRLEHGRLSLAWYYSSIADGESYFLPPILNPLDTPHGSPVHKVWFYRGSPHLQIAIFATTVVVAFLFGIGYRCQTVSIILWLLMNGIQNRSGHLSDGSDLYLRNLLLWCTVCDIGRVWSVDALIEAKKSATSSKVMKEEMGGNRAKMEEEYGMKTRSGTILTRRRRQNSQPGEGENGLSQDPYKEEKDTQDYDDISQRECMVMESIGALGCTLQIVLMYYGAVYRRFAGRMWMYPNFTAVYYVLNNAFATRQWASDFVRSHKELSRALTAGAMVVELACPLACFLSRCEGRSWRHLPAAILILLHLSLYSCMRLFNWQAMSIICCVLFLPPTFWNHLLVLDKIKFGESRSQVVAHRKKTQPTRKSLLGAKVKRFVSCFFLFYMVYNWCGERKWIAKHDGGDIGEFLRYNQNWLMYGPDVSTTSLVTLITGKIQMEDSNNSTNAHEQRRINIMKAIRTKNWGPASEIDQKTYLYMRHDELPGNMASRHPSWRWEVAVKDWVKDRVKPLSMTPELRVRRFGNVLCNAAKLFRNGQHQRITHIELAFWSMQTVDFTHASRDRRFQRSGRDDLVVEVEC